MKISATTMPSGVKATLMPSGASSWPIQPLRGVERGQRDAGDRGRQGERQIDQRVDEPLAGKRVAHQHPGDEQAEDGVDQRRRRSAAPKLSRYAASDARRGDGRPELRPGPAAALARTERPSGISTIRPEIGQA